MPTISMFYGIIIRMYCAPKEHAPSHFHAFYREYKVVININTCEVIEGESPDVGGSPSFSVFTVVH
jgi:hypothetical protein